MAKYDQIQALVEKEPGLTAPDIAIRLGTATEARIVKDCGWLVVQGRIQRHGVGGPSSPYRYYRPGAFAAFRA